MSDHPAEPTQASPEPDSRELDLLEVSSLLDGEHDPRLILEIIDRIAEDTAVRDFYRRARTLSGLIAATEPHPATEPPLEVWRRIASRAGLAVGGVASRSLRTRSAEESASPIVVWSRRLALAAGIGFLALTAGWFVQRTDHAPRLGNEPRRASSEGATSSLPTIEIGNDGSMTELRFVELASELLHADRRYRREMVRLIDTVEDNLQIQEGSADYNSNEGAASGTYDDFGAPSPSRPSVQLR